MKKLLLCSAVSLSVLLTACGGGGGGSAETPDGTKVDLTNSPKGDVAGNTAAGSLFGKNQNDSFYGVWMNDAKTVKELRYQGTSATGLPSGSATYVGESYWVSGTTGEVSKGGVTTLHVDFDKKIVNGNIEYSLFKDGRTQDITLHSIRLNGTTFNGNASTLLQKGTYEGALFGKGAKEAAGLVKFPNDSSYDASFGGVRY